MLKLAGWLLLLVVLPSVGLCTDISPTTLDRDIDPQHPGCTRAFERLPISKDGNEAIELDTTGSSTLVEKLPEELTKHYVNHSAEYQAFDTECFIPLICAPDASTDRCLKPWTLRVVNNSIGTLFTETTNNVFSPYCSAFRISDDYIVTAAHCVMSPMHFRLAGDPKTILNIDLADPDNIFGAPDSDVDDFAVLRVQRSPVVFDLPQSTFQRETLDRQSVNIVSISGPMFAIQRLKADDWLNAVRFTRLNAAQLWSFEEAGRPYQDTVLSSECLLYRVPTYPGSSGGPIIAVRRPSVNGADPKVFIVGIHLRNGYPISRCGDWREFNVGIRLPKVVLGRVR